VLVGGVTMMRATSMGKACSEEARHWEGKIGV
jgi:hypothetical protein